MSGYRILPRNAWVAFTRRGKLCAGRIVGVHLNPERKPGIGRVSYDIELHRSMRPIRIPAARIQP